jgi:ABC-type dipeptide transport system, periplasmic component
MKKTASVFLCMTMLLAVCGQNKSAQKPAAQATPQTQSAVTPISEANGEIDPVSNPSAPKGGTFTTWGSGFPKSLNVWLDNNSFSQEVMGYLFESLVSLHSTKNEPVGILAESWTISEDKKTFTFRINSNARWSDGKPISAEDVQFYFDVIMNPHNMTSLYRVDLQRLFRPEIIDEKTIRVRARGTHWSNFWVASGLNAFPKHVWGSVDFNKQNFDFPVVSGPYKIKEVEKNRYLVLERRGDWWGAAKKYNQGKYNFEFVKYKFMEDQNKTLEAFKKGDFDAYAIYTSSLWMKQTDFDAVQKGWVVKQKVYNMEPKAYQGFAINMRKEKFQDVRVRQSLCYLINRELMNEKLMFNQYFLLNSYFPDLYPNNCNPSVPVTHFAPDSARALLKAAGWDVGSDGFLAKNGRPFDISFLTYNVDFRHLNIYVEDLKKVGLRPAIEQLSQSTVTKRMDNHDFDLYWVNWSASRLRDPEAEWHSSTADQIASNNYTGLKDKTVDSLIEIQKTEMDINKRNDILRSIDRRLCEIVPYVQLWQADHNRILYWNRFGTPQYVFDKFDRENCIVTYWWLDMAKDAALQNAMKNNTPLPKEPFEVHYREQ